METIKVRIKKHTNKGAWYRNQIGNEFEVTPFSDSIYERVGGEFEYILKSDCEVLPTRIKKPSLDFLLGLKHGQRVRVSIDGTECEAVVNANEKKDKIYLCQDEIEGVGCNDKMGKKYSWCLRYHTQIKDIHWIELIDTPESVGGVKIGEVISFEWSAIDLSSVTLSVEETITFTEDEQVVIELLDGLVKVMMK